MNKRLDIKISYINFKKGFAMLFAVLTASLVLAIGISIFNLTIKELTLSSTGRESQFSFYSADTGIECVLYWDFSGATFSTPTVPRNTGIVPKCINQTLTGNSWTETSGVDGSGHNYVQTVFHLEIATPSKFPSGSYGTEQAYCAIITVTKTQESSGQISTKVESRGYNLDDALNHNCSTNSRNVLVERAIRVRY